MKKILKIPAHRIIFWFCFLPAISYTLLYEFILTKYPSETEAIYKMGVLVSKIFYSMLASSIFYFISQYIPIYLPRKQKKEKILNGIRSKSLLLEGLLMSLQKTLGLDKTEYQDESLLSQKLREFDLGSKVDNFKNFESFYANFKKEALEIVQSMLFYHDYLTLNYLNELQCIEKDILLPKIFNYDNYHLNGDIYFYSPMAVPTIQRLLITRGKLKELYKTEFDKA